MTVWDAGFHDGPEEERHDGGWEESDTLEDDDAPWRGEAHQYSDEGWRYAEPGPEEQMYREIMDEEAGEG